MPVRPLLGLIASIFAYMLSVTTVWCVSTAALLWLHHQLCFHTFIMKHHCSALFFAAAHIFLSRELR